MLSEQQAYDRLAEAYATLGWAPDPQAWSSLVVYWQWLQKWNQAFNLTAIRDPEQMLIKHVLDSLVVVPYLTGRDLRQSAPATQTAQRPTLLDVGTGAGLPGLVVAILCPEWEVFLLDSNSKKTRFLHQVKTRLALDNVTVLHQRVESHQPGRGYDVIVSRAFAAVQDFLALTEHLLAPQGSWWAMKSQKINAELETLPSFAKIQHLYTLAVPCLQAHRALVQLVPAANTADLAPRNPK